MNRRTIERLLVLLGDLRVEAGAGRLDFLVPFGVAIFRKIELQLLDAIDHLAEHALGIANDGDVRVDLPSDTRRHRIDLDVLRLVGPGRRLTEFFTAPETEANRHHRIGTSSERFFPRSSNREWILLRHRALTRATSVNRDAGQLDEFLDLGTRLRPEEPVASGDQRTLRRMQNLQRLIAVGRLALAANVFNGEAARTLALLRIFITVIENVLRDLEQRHALWRRNRLAECGAEVEGNRAPVGDALGELRKTVNYFGAVGFLERADMILGVRMLSRNAYDRAAGERAGAESGDGVGQAASSRNHAHPGFAGHARVGVGGIGGGLLVAHVDQLDIVTAQFNQNRKQMAAVDRKAILDP